MSRTTNGNGHKAKSREVYVITLAGQQVTVLVCPPGRAEGASLSLPGQSQPGLWGRRVRGNRRARGDEGTISTEEVFG